MKTRTVPTLAAIAAIVATLAAAAPSQAADLCLQFSGVSCDLSGDIGFFRFSPAKFPTSNKKPYRLNGRACGYGTATGTIAMSSDSTSINLSANFVCDATAGGITAYFAPGNGAVGATASNAYASYGDVELGSSCTATVVDCTTEP